MPSKTKIEANRQNALHSTGPRTSAGKAVASMNALRHGTYSQAVPILGEDPAEFAALTTEMVVSLQPVGPLEDRLVGRLAALWWRQDRAGRAEREGLKATLEEARYALGGTRLRFRDPFEDVLPDPAPDYRAPTHTAFNWGSAGEGMERLQRYEGQLERRFFAILHELERIQARRRGQVVPPPVVVTLTGSVD
jgi:hypothetical protein